MEPVRQVDVIYWDVETVRNLHDAGIYRQAKEDLLHTDDALLSSTSVDILEFVLADHSWNSVANDDSEDVRIRAVVLLGISRSPKAIAIVTDRMFNDPAWRVRRAAAKSLGRLAGEAALPALLAAQQKHKISKINRAFGFAGGNAVPHIIRWMEEDFAENGGQNHAHTHIIRLRWIGDRRAIDPLLRIVAHPGSPSDPSIVTVRSEAATTLGHFASEVWYSYLPDRPSTYLAVDPVTCREKWRVSAADRKRITKALQNAGYDADRLVPFSTSLSDGNAE